MFNYIEFLKLLHYKCPTTYPSLQTRGRDFLGDGIRIPGGFVNKLLINYFSISLMIMLSMSLSLFSGTVLKICVSFTTLSLRMIGISGCLSLFLSLLSGIHSSKSLGVHCKISQSFSISFKSRRLMRLFAIRVAKLSE